MSSTSKTASAVADSDRVQVGVGLWSMRSTAFEPKSFSDLYAELRADSIAAEALGFDSIWLCEHHLSFDGWCPQPLIAAAACLAATTELRVGTAMHLLPLHDLETTKRDVGTILDCFGDRLDLGVSLGYRDEEYRAFGLELRHRGKRMDHHLDEILLAFGRCWPTPQPIYLGGIAPAASTRAAHRGLSLLLPNSIPLEEVRNRVAQFRLDSAESGGSIGRVGMVVDTWVCPDEVIAEKVKERLVQHYREYAGAWFELKGEHGFSRPDLLDQQSSRTRQMAAIGSAEFIVEKITALHEAGVRTFVLQVRSDVKTPDYRAAMEQVASDVVPSLRALK